MLLSLCTVAVSNKVSHGWLSKQNSPYYSHGSKGCFHAETILFDNETFLHNEIILLRIVSLWISVVLQWIKSSLKSTEGSAREWHNEITLFRPVAEKPCRTRVFTKKRTKVAIPMVS